MDFSDFYLADLALDDAYFDWQWRPRNRPRASLTLLSPPTAEPVTLADAKNFLRVDVTDDDALIGDLLIAARQTVEAYCGRALVTQTWRLALDAWPRGGMISLPVAPFQSFVGARTLDPTGAATALDPTTYVLDSSPEVARIVFSQRPPELQRVAAGVQVDWIAGYGPAPTDPPAALRLAIRSLVASWYEDRGDQDFDAAAGRVPRAVAAALAPYRRTRLK
ncbi:MAG: head-tail connector protein [Hyphomicrobiales bacterium]|nr:head-tail connector protein [Hyphomicrobiales bacterium]